MDNFVNHYIDENGQNVECITRFFAYNRELVKKDREKIFAYLIDTYGINKERLTVSDFLTDKNAKVINNLNSLEDLDNLEKVIGLAIISGLLIDDFRLRFIFLNEIGSNHIFLDREKFDFSSEENTYLYFTGLKKHIINNQVFLVNMEIVKSYKQMDKEKSSSTNESVYTSDELKECLFNWLTDTKKIAVTEELKNIYRYLLNNRLSDMVNFVTYLITNELPAEYLLMYFYRDSTLSILDGISKNINALDEEAKKVYEDYRAKIITELMDNYKNKNKHK